MLLQIKMIKLGLLFAILLVSISSFKMIQEDSLLQILLDKHQQQGIFVLLLVSSPSERLAKKRSAKKQLPLSLKRSPSMKLASSVVRTSVTQPCGRDWKQSKRVFLPRAESRNVTL